MWKIPIMHGMTPDGKCSSVKLGMCTGGFVYTYLKNKYHLTWTRIHCDLLFSDLLNKTLETCFVLKTESIQPKGVVW